MIDVHDLRCGVFEPGSSFCGGFLLIIGRLYFLQIIQGPELKHKAHVQRQQHNLLVHRGAITDRHGLPLAIDTTRYDVYVHPKLIKAGIAEASGISRQNYSPAFRKTL